MAASLNHQVCPSHKGHHHWCKASTGQSAMPAMYLGRATWLLHTRTHGWVRGQLELTLAHGTFGISLDISAVEFLCHVPPTFGEVETLVKGCSECLPRRTKKPTPHFTIPVSPPPHSTSFKVNSFIHLTHIYGTAPLSPCLKLSMGIRYLQRTFPPFAFSLIAFIHQGFWVAECSWGSGGTAMRLPSCSSQAQREVCKEPRPHAERGGVQPHCQRSLWSPGRKWSH